MGIEDDNDVYKDASEAGEVFMRQPAINPPVQRMNGLTPVLQMVSIPPPTKSEMYDGAADWWEYQVYCDQLVWLG